MIIPAPVHPGDGNATASAFFQGKQQQTRFSVSALIVVIPEQRLNIVARFIHFVVGLLRSYSASQNKQNLW